MRALSRTQHATPFRDRRFIAFRFGTDAEDLAFLSSVRPWDQDKDRLNSALRGLIVGDLAYRGISWCKSIPTVINQNSWNHILQPKHGLTRDSVKDFIQHICICKNLVRETPKDVGRLLTYKDANVVAQVFEHKDGRRLLNNAFVATKGAEGMRMGAMASSRAVSYALHGIILGTLDAMQANPGNQSAAFVGGVVGGTASSASTCLILSSNPLSLPTAAVLGFSSGYMGALVGGQLAVFLTDEKIDTFGSDTARSPAQLGQQLQFLGNQEPFHDFRWNESEQSEAWKRSWNENHPDPVWDFSVVAEYLREQKTVTCEATATYEMNDYIKVHPGIKMDIDVVKLVSERDIDAVNISPKFRLSIDSRAVIGDVADALFGKIK